MKIRVNWIKTPQGNGIEEGSTLTITADGADHISGGIYKKGFPVLAIFGKGSKASIKVKRLGISLKGPAVLKVRAYDKYYRGSGIDDAFEIV